MGKILYTYIYIIIHILPNNNNNNNKRTTVTCRIVPGTIQWPTTITSRTFHKAGDVSKVWCIALGYLPHFSGSITPLDDTNLPLSGVYCLLMLQKSKWTKLKYLRLPRQKKRIRIWVPCRILETSINFLGFQLIILMVSCLDQWQLGETLEKQLQMSSYAANLKQETHVYVYINMYYDLFIYLYFYLYWNLCLYLYLYHCISTGNLMHTCIN